MTLSENDLVKVNIILKLDLIRIVNEPLFWNLLAKPQAMIGMHNNGQQEQCGNEELCSAQGEFYLKLQAYEIAPTWLIYSPFLQE